jgi:FlaG/FlaF family flagellin (archaellin)
MNEENTIPTEQKSGAVGGIIGAIIIIVILAAGAWYFIGNRVEKIEQQKAANKVLDVSTGASTEINDIQTDLDNLDMKVLD